MNDFEHLKELCRRLAELMPKRFTFWQCGVDGYEWLWKFKDLKLRRSIVSSLQSMEGQSWAFFGPLLAEFDVHPKNVGDPWCGGDPLTAVVLAVVDAVERKVKK